MASVAILVNGLPGSGKTTLARTLAAVLGCPALSVDVVQESLAGLTGPVVATTGLRSVATDAVWSLAAEIEAGVVVEAAFHADRDRDAVRAGLERAGRPRTVEVWCDVDPEVALGRTVERVESGARSRLHGTAQEVREAWPELVAGAAPLGAWPVVRVDAGGEVDLDALVTEIGAHFG